MSKRPALALLAFSSLITSLDFTIIYVALPDIARDVGFSAHSTQWVVSAYAIFFGGLLLLGGRSADLLGRRRMFVLGMALFGAASLLGGFATSTTALIAARAIQGIGAAVLFPATLSLVNTMFEEGRQRIRALAVWAGAGAGGVSLGALLGGVLTSAFGWQAVFLVNVPLVIAGTVAAFLVLRADGPRDRGRFDVPGAITGTAGTTLLVFTVAQGPETGWTSAPVLIGGVSAVVLLAAFLVVEARSAGPLMPLRLARKLGPVLAVIFVFGGTMQNVVYFLTLFVQNVWRYSALVTGLVFLSLSVVIATANFVAERLMVRIGIRTTLISGLLLGAVGSALLAAGMVADGSYWTILAGILVYGAGMGTVFPTVFAAAGTGVAEQEQGSAGGLANTALQVGTGVGLAVLVGIANAGSAGLDGEALRIATADGLRTTVVVSAALTLLGLLAAVALPGRAKADDTTVAEPVAAA
ncbi:drug resistance transporter, EmrB/QacA subfamily [Saccharopolyspora antimicrobica]|uniref:Drug resistance transporter, EmrB/QacA subfamily n=1 Tax=Saccharopolyspora antimicrobica TaxID=455193 RepID=A0A1I5DPQ2_9PSEU|nr:MFS transporter [Saccharopolyspora antimicrobica]RKT85033.1 EmrB/QacA subfamily drug resistance transporter [Saccharopolyspora antimicrobica]SFO01245.1 drug resistance transporter, EmrB/QacA subfamily [Saccharopolyspora antimicrobica]